MNFAVPADQRVKLKERKKRDKYVDLAWEMNNRRNIKVKVILIAIGALGTVTKRLVEGLEGLEIRGRTETIQTIALLRSAGILRRVLRIEETCCRLNSSEKPSVNAGGKYSQRSKIIIVTRNHINTYKLFELFVFHSCVVAVKLFLHTFS